jgi:hypothetical protein
MLLKARAWAWGEFCIMFIFLFTVIVGGVEGV